MSWVPNDLCVEKILFLLLSWWDDRPLTSLPRFWIFSVFSSLVDPQLLGCLRLSSWAFVFLQACTHPRWYHLGPWLEINLYDSDPRSTPLTLLWIPDTSFISLLGCLKSNPPHNSHPHKWALCLLVCFASCPSPKSGIYPWFFSLP